MDNDNPFDANVTREKKSSSIIKLCLLASVAAVAGGVYYAMDSVEERDVPKDYATEQECVLKTGDGDMCRNAFEGAKEDHLLNAPKFGDLKSCEEQFGAGNCATPNAPTQPATADQSASSGSGIFMPMMAGFLLSRVLSSGNNYSFGSIYRNANGEMYTGRCDQQQRCNAGSSNFMGTGRPGSASYSGSFVNSWMRGGSAAPSMSKSSTGGFSRSPAISRGGFGGSFHSSGG